MIEDPSTLQKHGVIIPVVLTVADRAITVPNWEYEANPIVTSLGVESWLMVTVIALMSMLFIWYRMELYRSKIAQACVLFLGALMTFVLVSNAWVVYG